MDGFGDLVDVIEFPGKIMDSVDPTHQLWKKVKKKRKELIDTIYFPPMVVEREDSREDVVGESHGLS